MSAIWDCADAKLTFCIGRLRGRLSAFSLRKGDPGPDDDPEVLTKGSICDVLAKVPSLSRLRVTLKKGDGGDGGTKSMGSKTLSLSESDANDDIEKSFDLSRGLDRLTVKELWSQSRSIPFDAVDSVELKCLSKESLESGDMVMTEGGFD